jgi:predicted dehydrogenase
VEVAAHGDSYLHAGVADVVTCYLRFATGIAATVRLSSLDARPSCRVSAFGARRTAVFDEHDPDKRLAVYEQSDGDEGRSGEILVPRLPRTSPLQLECESFLAGARSGTEPPRPQLARRVVALLETIERTLASDERGARSRQEKWRPPQLVLLAEAREQSAARRRTHPAP